jgi:PAS domain S-box-containing protein
MGRRTPVMQDDLLQRFIDSANVAIYLKDGQGRFLMVNRRCAEILKASKEEIIGKTDYDFVSKEAADQFRAYDRRVAEAGTPMTFKVTFSSPDGPHTILDHKFPVSDIEGSPKAVGGIGMDISTTE